MLPIDSSDAEAIINLYVDHLDFMRGMEARKCPGR